MKKKVGRPRTPLNQREGKKFQQTSMHLSSFMMLTEIAFANRRSKVDQFDIIMEAAHSKWRKSQTKAKP